MKYIINHKYILIFIIFLWVCCVSKAENTYYIRRYAEKYNLPNYTISKIHQDKKGFIWCGTKRGAYRFNNKSFTPLSELIHDKSKAIDKYIENIFEDSQHQLWMYSMHELTRFNYTNGNIEEIKSELIGNNPNFYGISEDLNENIWIAIDNKIVKYDLNSKEISKVDTITASTLSNRYKDNIWASDQNFNLIRYNAQNGDKKILNYNLKKANKLTKIIKIVQINDSTLMLGSSNIGGISYNIKTEKATKVTPSTIIYDIERFKKNEIWFASEEGIYIYDLQTSKTRNMKTIQNNSYSLPDNCIYSLCKDTHGGLFIGSYFKGLSYMPNQTIRFKLFIAGQTEPDLRGNIINEFCKDNLGNLWIGTEDNGLNKYNYKTKKYTHYSKNNPQNKIKSQSINGIICIGNQLWYGSFNNGIEVLDIKSGRVIKNIRYTDDENSLLSDYVLSLYYNESENTVYIGTDLGLQSYNLATKKFKTIDKSLLNRKIYNIYEDNIRRIWVSTSNGLHKIENQLVTSFYHDKNHKHSISASKVHQVIQTEDGAIWAATSRGISRFNEVNQTFTTFAISTKEMINNIYRIVEDKYHCFWLSTELGLIQYNPVNGLSYYYTKADGLPDSRFSQSSSLKKENGDILMGTVNGFFSFTPPKEVFINRLDVNLELTKFTHSTSKKDFYDYFPLANHEKNYKLKYNENNVTFHFSALTYTCEDSNLGYTYKLEGYDEEWTRSYGSVPVKYQNLPPGNYVFKVKSTNADAIWQNNEVKFPFTILRPYWETTTAYVIYFIVFILTLWILVKLYLNKEQAKKDSIRDEINREKEKELYNAKIQFFTTIAHEIRTPLTLISLPLEKILESNDLNEKEIKRLTTIKENTNRLTKLTNQLLDFRKSEANELSLNFTKTDIKDIIEQVINSHHEFLENKNVSINYSLPEKEVLADVDIEAFSKICNNLINNAAKYCEHTISILLEKKKRKIYFTIINDGETIESNDQKNLFKLFFRTKRSDKKIGSGVGLNVAKQLVELHHGTLVYSITENQENKFKLTLPINQELAFENIYSHAPNNNKEENEKSTLVYTKKKNLLIVEDQKELQNYLSDSLKSTYNVLKASNGKEALKIIEKHPISIIVSDIMMPKMDGIELCKTLKEDNTYCQIPIILITAKSNSEEKLEGYKIGADAYIEKPFSMKLLSARINNLLTSRKKLYETFLDRPQMPFEPETKNNKEKLFVTQFTKLVNDEMNNPKLDMELLSKKMGMSESSLYKKSKKILQVTPNDFIRINRLKKGAELLLNSELRINEIAYQIGFSSASYFSSCFQKQFGLTPSEYIKKNSK